MHRLLQAVLITSALMSPTAQAANPDQATGKAKPNALYQHPSPYLALHGRDPVRWQPWNEQTLRQARREDKLLFVSIGYYACHWCHVMQRESFQNDDIAALLNRHFIPVKVDREIDAALDAKLIDFVENTQGISGWPLNVFVTPAGYPLVGMVYVPPQNFEQVLSRLIEEWDLNRQDMKNLARQASAELAPARTGSDAELPAGLGEQYATAFVEQSFIRADELQGGFGQENKFPSVPQLDTLLTLSEQRGGERIGAFLNLTLEYMASQGLRDQLGGGFYRYVIDPTWQVPHFEKMLYDNALLSELYLRAARVFAQPAYARVAYDTLDFMLDEMRTAEGAMLASLSAVDEQDVEGGYYLWDASTVRQALSEAQWRVVSRLWQLQGPPDLDDGHHLVQAMSRKAIAEELNLTVDEVRTAIAAARQKLLDIRERRVLPRDDKRIASWNALAMSALLEAAARGEHPRYLEAARDIHAYIVESLWDGERLWRFRSADSATAGQLEDYAYVSRALLALWRHSGEARHKQQLEQILSQGWRRFYTEQGWRLNEDSLLKYRSGQTHVMDGPLPSPSAVLMDTTLAFAEATGDRQLEKRALKALNVGHDQVMAQAFWHASLIATVLDLQPLSPPGK